MERTLSEKEFREIVEDVKEVSEDEKSIVHWITTESVDRYGDIVRAKGMDDESYAKNPVVLYGHDYGGFPVGKSLWRKRTTRNGVKGVIAKTQFAPTPEGQLTFELWKGGFLNAASIGFRSRKTAPITDDDQRFTGYDIAEWELLEYSIVPVPANQDALRLAIEKGIDAPKILNPLRESIFEARVIELESAKKDLDEKLKSLTPNAEFQSFLSAIGERFSNLEGAIEELKAQLTRKPDAVATLTAEQLKSIGLEIGRGAARQILGRV